jgi:hypothetical protein
VRWPISLEDLHRDKGGGQEWEGDALDMLLTPATKSKLKAAGAGGVIKISGCNKMCSVCAAEPTDPLSKDAGKQSVRASPRRLEALMPHADEKRK